MDICTPVGSFLYTLRMYTKVFNNLNTWAHKGTLATFRSEKNTTHFRRITQLIDSWNI